MSEKFDYVVDVEESMLSENLQNENSAQEARNKNCGCGCTNNEMEEEAEGYETNLGNCPHPHPHGVTCTRVHTQSADVSLPVKVKPYAKMGVVETRCCGEPTITMRHCPGPENGCDMVITQTICARIPIEYGVIATSGEATITCRRMGDTK